MDTPSPAQVIEKTEPIPQVQDLDEQSGIKGLVDESVAEGRSQQGLTPAVSDALHEEAEPALLQQEERPKPEISAPQIQPESRPGIGTRLASALSVVFPFSRIGNAKISAENEMHPEPFIPPIPDNIPSAEAFMKNMKKMESHNAHNAQRVEYYVNAAKNGNLNVEDFFRNTEHSAVYVERK